MSVRSRGVYPLCFLEAGTREQCHRQYPHELIVYPIGGKGSELSYKYPFSGVF